MMNIELLEPIRQKGHILEPGTRMNLSEPQARKLIDLGLARQVEALSVGSWVTFGPPPDRTGQIVSSEEGTAIVRVFTQVGGFHDFRCSIDTLKQTAPSERAAPASQVYRVGQSVQFSRVTALGLCRGVVAETKQLPSRFWYRIDTEGGTIYGPWYRRTDRQNGDSTFVRELPPGAGWDAKFKYEWVGKWRVSEPGKLWVFGNHIQGLVIDNGRADR